MKKETVYFVCFTDIKGQPIDSIYLDFPDAVRRMSHWYDSRNVKMCIHDQYSEDPIYTTEDLINDCNAEKLKR